MSDNPLHARTISASTICDKETEAKLMTENPDSMRETLMVNNVRLVYRIAGKYARYNNTNCTLDDLVSAGMLGLATAANKFDPAKGNKFTTYAYHWIMKYVLQQIYVERDEHHIGGSAMMSLSAPTMAEDDNHSLSDKAEVDEEDPLFISTNPFEGYMDQDRAKFINNMLTEFLTDDERWVIEKTYLTNKKHSMAELARESGFSPFEIKNMRETALAKLRLMFKINNETV